MAIAKVSRRDQKQALRRTREDGASHDVRTPLTLILGLLRDLQT
jgi:K+-sensing histidine kinase KdpD